MNGVDGHTAASWLKQRWAWPGQVVGPIEWGGARFWAVAGIHDGAVCLSGAVVTGGPWPAAMEQASLLAPYAPRAVVVPDRRDVTDLLIEAALLDQGLALINRHDRITPLLAPGPRTSSAGGSREGRLLTAISGHLLPPAGPASSPAEDSGTGRAPREWP